MKNEAADMKQGKEDKDAISKFLHQSNVLQWEKKQYTITNLLKWDYYLTLVYKHGKNYIYWQISPKISSMSLEHF